MEAGANRLPVGERRSAKLNILVNLSVADSEYADPDPTIYIEADPDQIFT